MTERLLVATRKGLFAARRRGSEWSWDPPSFLGVPVSAVLRDPRDGAWYAGLAHGHFGPKLHRSDDEGRTWTELPTPAIPSEGPDGASVEMLWCLEAGHADRPGELWAGTIPGALFRSTDRGESWTLVEGLWNRPERGKWFGGGYDHPGIHSILVDPRDGRRVLIAISSGGVWETTDGGESWRGRSQGLLARYMPPGSEGDPNVQDPHRVVLCPSAPDLLWTQHHSGIFRSTDGAASWREVTAEAPSRFGFAVAVDPNDGNTAWFVPAVSDECRVPVGGRFAVTRTDDGGETFRVLGEGLPSSGAYHLVYRHGLDVDGEGRRLAVGTTTGALWLSEDRGERFACLSAHLPPVAAVRFA